MHARRIAPWVAAFLTVAGAAGAMALDILASGYGDGALTGAAWIAATVASTGVGLVLATRRRDNPIGWLLLANGLVLAAEGLAESYADYAVLAHPDALPGGEWAVLFADRGWPILFVGVTAIAFVFPDGRLPSPRWRPIAIAAVASFATLIVVSMFSTDPFSEPFERISSPLPRLPEAVVAVPFTISALGALASLVAAAFAVRTRLKRSSGLERLQIKWLAYAAMLIPAAVVICLAEAAITGSDGPATVVALVVPLIAIPAAIGIAVMRYRLYDVDRLINRTLVYAVLTAALAATFAAVSLLLGVAIGAGSTLPTAAATLAVALVFGPLRSRVQVLVDRRFDRARFEGLRTVERYLAELRAGRAAPEATGEILAEALGDPGLELFFWLPEEETYVDASGHAVDELPGEGRARTPVQRGELHLATVVHKRSLDERPDLLESVIEAAGLAIEIARLRAEVRRRLAEVEESRARIVTAGYEERRRLERDLHDGAQQRLVSIGLALRHVQGQLPTASREADELDTTVGEVSCAIEELRELARGVRPAGLDDGLAPALRELASRSPLRTRVEASEERFEDGIETAAYFVASEALANAAKHADASEVTLNAERRNGNLFISVRDDGVGGAHPSEGSGLAGMADRVAALGGSLRVESPPGRGTVVSAELPCGL
jgi:signal transduction histidine kinase